MNDNQMTRAERLATLFSCAFWALSLGVMGLFLWSAAIGGMNPGDVLPMSGGVALLVVLWLLRSRAMSRHRFEVTHDPKAIRQFERRGFY
jgi:hypothetical protein